MQNGVMVIMETCHRWTTKETIFKWWIMTHKLDHYEKAGKIKKMVRTF